MPEPGQSFRAKYLGVCAAGCDNSINPGDFMVWYSPQELYHFDCRPRGKEELQQPEKLGQKGFLFTDTETGGLDHKGCALIQISAIATSPQLLIQAVYSSLIKPPPNLTITEKATQVHGHTRESLRKERTEAVVIPEFLAWCEKYPEYRFAGYKCGFDLDFLVEAFKRSNIFTKPWLTPAYDLLDRAREKLGGRTQNHKLVTIAKHYGFTFDDKAHDATADIFRTVQVARCLENEGNG